MGRLSQPIWAAWIEILYAAINHICRSIVAAHLGCVDWNVFLQIISKLKLWSQPIWAAWIEINSEYCYSCGAKSQPIWAAWIEIYDVQNEFQTKKVAAHLGCVDWNNFEIRRCSCCWWSQPIWAAWIEIYKVINYNTVMLVAAHLGCVDWNRYLYCSFNRSYVAAHLGCVDWNNLPVSTGTKGCGRSPFGLRGLKSIKLLIIIL